MSNRSKIWDYFVRKTKETAECKKCNKTLKCCGGSTSSLSSHVKKVHGININESDSSAFKKQKTLGEYGQRKSVEEEISRLATADGELKQRNTGGEPEESQSLEDCTTEAGNVEQINTEINSPIDTDNDPLQTIDQQPSKFRANVLESSDSHGDKRENNVTSEENQEPKRKRVKNTSSLKAREMNIDSAINRLESVVTLASNARQQDLFDVFGRYVSDQLKQLPRRQAILAQSKIQNLLIQEFLDYEDTRN